MSMQQSEAIYQSQDSATNAQQPAEIGTSDLQQHIYEQRITYLESKLSSNQVELDKMAEEVRQQQLQASLVQQQAHTSASEVASAQAAVQEWKQKLEAAQTENDLIRRSQLQYKEKLDELEASLASTREEQKKENADLKAKYREAIVEKGQKEFLIVELEQKVALTGNTVIHLTSEKEQLMKILEDKNAEVQLAKSQVYQQGDQIKDLERQLASKERELKKQQESFTFDFEQERKRGEHILSELSSLRSQFEAERLRGQSFDTECQRLLEQCSRFENQSKQIENELSACQLQMQKVQKNFEMATQVKEKLEKEKLEHMKELHAVKTRLKSITLAKTSQDLSMVIDSDQLIKYQNEFSEFVQKADDAQAQLDQLTHSNKVMTKQLGQCKTVILEQSQQMNRISSENQELRKAQQSFAEKLEAERKQFSAVYDALSRRQQDYVVLYTNYELLEKAVKETDFLNKVQQKANQLRTQANQNPQQLYELQQKDKAIEQFAFEAQEKESLMKEVEALKSSCKDLHEQLEKKEALILQIHSKLQRSESSGKDNLQPKEANDQKSLSQGSYNSQLNQIQKAFGQQLEEKLKEINELRSQLIQLQNQVDKQALESAHQGSQSINLRQQEGQYVSQEDVQALKDELAHKSNALQNHINQVAIFEEKLKMAEQREQVEKIQKLFFESRIRDYELLLKKSQDEREELTRVAMQSVSPAQQNQRSEQVSQFQKIIEGLNEEKLRLQKELNGRQIEEIQTGAVIKNQELMLTALKQQVQREREAKEQAEQFVQRYLNNQQQQQVMAPHGSQQQMGGVREAKGVEKTNQDLKQLLMQQKEDNENILREKDVLIDNLLQAFKEVEAQRGQQDAHFEAEIKRLTESSAAEVAGMSAQLAKVQDENMRLVAELHSVRSQLDVFNKEKEKLEITGEMQNAEILRLQEITSASTMAGASGLQRQQSSTQMGQVNSQQFKELNERVENLSIKYYEKEQQCEGYARQLSMMRASFEEEKNKLNDEKDSLKDLVAIMKKEVKVLSQHLEEVKQANIRVNSGSGVSASAPNDATLKELELIMREKQIKAEAEVEKVRAEYYSLLESNRKLISDLNERTFKLIRIEEEMKVMQQQNTYRVYQLRQLQELNEQNQDLITERNLLKEQLERVREQSSAKQVEPAVQARSPVIQVQSESQKQEMGELKARFGEISSMYEQLKKEMASREDKVPEKSQNKLFQTMFKTVHRAKQLFDQLNVELATDPNNPAQSQSESLPLLGKRQRTE